MRRVIAALLRLYPARFRRTLGDDLLATFDDQWRDRGNWRQATRTVASLASGAALERLHGCKGDGRMTTLFYDLRFGARRWCRSTGTETTARPLPRSRRRRRERMTGWRSTAVT